VADLHFAQQSDREQVQPAEQQAESQHHERPVRSHDRDVAQELLRAQPQDNGAAPKHAGHAESSEEVQRTRKITQQKPNRQQIKKHAERPRDAVMRSPTFAVHVADGHFANRSPMPGSERRNKAVQFAIERNLVKNVAAVSLKRRAEVVNIHAAQLSHQPVRNLRRNAAHPEIIDANLAPAADNVVTGGNLFQKQRDVGGIVLQIAVHGDDVFAAGVVKSGGEPGSLAKVAAQLDHRNAAVDGCNLAQRGESAVARTIVHQNNFKRLAGRFHHRFQAVIEVGDVLLLVVQGDDDGVLGHDLFIIADGSMGGAGKSQHYPKTLFRRASAAPEPQAKPESPYSFSFSLDLFSSRKVLMSAAAPSRRFHCS
jgi:hypothetical protein